MTNEEMNAIPISQHPHGHDRTARIVWESGPLHIYSVVAGFVVTDWTQALALPDTFQDRAAAETAARKWRAF